MKTYIFLAASAALLLFPTIADAGDDKSLFATDVGVGTTGLAGNVQMPLSRQVVVRGGYNFLALNLDDQEYDGVLYNSELDFNTVGGFIDFHPFRNAFTLSGGTFFGEKTVRFDATPMEPVEIGDIVFAPHEVGTLLGNAEMQENAGYLGLGYDNVLYSAAKWSVFARAGVMFSGSPQVELISAGGDFSAYPGYETHLQTMLDDELAKEEQNLQNDLDKYTMLPVVSIGVALKL